MKCELCKDENLDFGSTEIVSMSKDIEKWSFKLCSKCSQMIDEYVSSKVYTGINNLFKKKQEKKNV